MATQLLDHFQSKAKNIEERKAFGKGLRKKFPHNKMGEYKPASNRADPVAILEKQAKTRFPSFLKLK